MPEHPYRWYQEAYEMVRNGGVSEEIARYFEARTKRLDIVHTTRTPGGQILDWIPVDSQHPHGRIATPPPGAPPGNSEIMSPQGHEAPAMTASRKLTSRAAKKALPDRAANDRPARFELDNQAVERGPAGTVPVVRKDFTRIHVVTSLRQYLAKRGKVAMGPIRKADPRWSPPPNPDLSHYFHATSSESIACFGVEGFLNVWDPHLENSGDHSLSQAALQNHDQATHSLEGGWEVSKDQYGDWDPHLFVYYTTNNYAEDDDNLGGYNHDVDGWVQVDQNIYPAARIIGASAPGGDQRFINIKYELFESNWWFQVMGTWIGYYPASLFMGNQSVFATLGDHADWVAFFGEVFTDDANANLTRTQMGSGAFGEGGYGRACYQRNLRVQTHRNGTMSDHNGFPSAENSALYDIKPQMKSGTSWGSFFFAGGPGAVVPWGYIGGFFPSGGTLATVSRRPEQLDVFTCGNDGVVYTNWWNPNDPWPGHQNAWMPIGGFFPPRARVSAVSRNADQLDLFVCGNDGVVYTNWWNPNDPWPGRQNAWMPIGGIFPAGAPVSVVSRSPDQLDLFVCGNDGVVYTNWWNPNDPWPGRQNAWMPIGGFFPPGAPIAVVSRNPDQLDLFVCGNDGVVYTNWWNPNDPWPGRQNAWMPIGGFFPPRARVSAVSRNPDQLDLFVCGNDGVVYTNWWNPNDPWPGRQNAWMPIGGFFPPGASLAVVSRNPDQLDVFVCGNDGVVYTNWWNPNDPWPGRQNAWMPIGGIFPPGAPLAAVARKPEQLDVFVCGNDGVVYTNWWNPGANWPGSSGR